MQRFKNILVLVDADAEGGAALAKAVWLAKANEARLTLLDVAARERGALAQLFDSISADDGAKIDASAVEDALHQARRDAVNAMAQSCRDAGVEADTALRGGPIFISAIRQVLEAGHDLVMKSASPSGDAFFLSDDLHLMRKCPCPVWILKDDGSGDASVRTVLAALDPADPDDEVRDALAHTVMTLATSLAERTGARLHVVNAWRLHEESTLRTPRFKMEPASVDAIVERERRQSLVRLNALLEDFPDPSGARVVEHRKGHAGDIAPAYVTEIGADMLVMGTVARTGLSGFIIGNSAETILNRVRCSVMTVKPPGFVSPVALDGEGGAA